ncbi:hypothetical protein C8J56DRAFT_893733 [Mycena floridula]|nr:hypothetical protein C8J56DRAFT_893733 [Mycena floridula]
MIHGSDNKQAATTVMYGSYTALLIIDRGSQNVITVAVGSASVPARISSDSSCSWHSDGRRQTFQANVAQVDASGHRFSAQVDLLYSSTASGLVLGQDWLRRRIATPADNRPAPLSSPHQTSDAPASQSGAPGASEAAHDAPTEKDKDKDDNMIMIFLTIVNFIFLPCLQM